MEIEFDLKKDQINRAKHGLSLAESEFFEWETATVREDVREAYEEQRFCATGFIGARVPA
jgi:uncharacterized DUF497 family protein